MYKCINSTYLVYGTMLPVLSVSQSLSFDLEVKHTRPQERRLAPGRG